MSNIGTLRVRLATTLTALLLATVVLGAARPNTARADTTSDEAQLFELTNAARVAAGRAALQYDPAASEVARGWAQSMAASRSLGHNPDLAGQVDAYVTSEWTRLGENVGYGPSISAVHTALMGSSSHRTNILGDYNRAGIGAATDGGGQVWVTEVFIKAPALSAPVAAAPMEPLGPAVQATSGTRTDIVRRGADGQLWATARIDGVWKAWYSLGGRFVGDPDITSWGNGRLDIFGTSTDGSLWHRAWINGWTPWESLGGRFTSGPGAVAWGSGRLDVFVRGFDNQLWSRSWKATGGWGPWYGLGGSFIGDPDVASWASGRLDVFATGTDGRLWSRSFGDRWWGPWYTLGGGPAAGPGAVSWGSSRIDVFIRGADGSLWSRAFSGRWWGDWAYIGNQSASGPDASSSRSGSLTVFVQALDGSFRETVWNGGVWSSWRSIG